MSFQDADLLDRYAYLDTAVHRLDPRAKLAATLAFVLAVVSFPKYAVGPLLPYLIFPLAMSILAFLPAKVVIKRALLALPFVVLVGIFNPLLDRAPALQIMGLTISGGWVSFASIVVRGLLCVSAAVILMATSSFPRLLKALRFFRVPKVLTVQLMIMYRYLFLLIGEGLRMRRAHSLRSAAGRVTPREASSILSALLIRALDRADAVWLAMKSRGFDGDMPLYKTMKWRNADTMFLIAVSAAAIALRLAPLTDLLGKWAGL